jgi:hypothetical protein
MDQRRQIPRSVSRFARSPVANGSPVSISRSQLIDDLNASRSITIRVLVVDDQPDVETLFRQQSRRSSIKPSPEAASPFSAKQCNAIELSSG